MEGCSRPDLCPASRKVKPDKEMIEKLHNGGWNRSSGLCQCKSCGKNLFCHNSIEGNPVFVVDCEGNIHKL